MKIAAGLFFLAVCSVGARADLAQVGALAFDLPPGLKLQTQPRESTGEAAYSHWRAEDGRSIEVYVYAHYIRQERGGIVAANKDPIEVAGQRTKLIETKIFFGEPKRVLAVYVNFRDTIYLIVGDRMTLKDFLKFLQSVDLVEGR
jgi:hypothetical protein